jgi:hypothetical protein
VYIEVRQLGNLNDIWNVTVERDYPQELEPRTNQTVRFVVDAPESAELNETRTYIVNMYIDGELMGGVQIEVVKEEPQPPPILPDWIVIAAVGFVIIVLIVYFIRVRRR